MYWQGPFSFLFFFFFLRFLFIYFKQRRREGEKEGEKHQCVVASCTSPCGGPGLQPSHVPWLGIELATLWFAGRYSIHWATLAREGTPFLVQLYTRGTIVALTSSGVANWIFLGCGRLLIHRGKSLRWFWADVRNWKWFGVSEYSGLESSALSLRRSQLKASEKQSKSVTNERDDALILANYCISSTVCF